MVDGKFLREGGSLKNAWWYVRESMRFLGQMYVVSSSSTGPSKKPKREFVIHVDIMKLVEPHLSRIGGIAAP